MSDKVGELMCSGTIRHQYLMTVPGIAPFRLSGSANCTRESLEIRAWFDGSVLEVFVE